MREHHYKFGQNGLNYETSSKRVEHLNRTLELDRQPMRSLADAKKELDGHHFDFGHESPPKQTTHQRVFEKSVILFLFISPNLCILELESLEEASKTRFARDKYQ